MWLQIQKSKMFNRGLFLKPIFLIVNENAINNKINKYQYLMNDYTLWLIMYIINNASMERHADLTRNRVMTKSRKKRNIREKSLLIPLKKRLQKRLRSYISDQKKKIESKNRKIESMQWWYLKASLSILKRCFTRLEIEKRLQTWDTLFRLYLNVSLFMRKLLFPTNQIFIQTRGILYCVYVCFVNSYTC